MRSSTELATQIGPIRFERIEAFRATTPIGALNEAVLRKVSRAALRQL